MNYTAIARQEVRRAVRRNPRWMRYKDDLLQDGVEAALRSGAEGGALRMWIRGAVLRAGLAYFGVSERTGLTPSFVGLDAPDAQTLSAVPAPIEARLVLGSIGGRAAPRTQAILVALHGGATVREAAKVAGISHETAYKELRLLREAA